MDLDVTGIILCIRQGDGYGVQKQLQQFNREYAECFFFDAEEKERKKFKKNKVRDSAYDSDSDCNDDFPRDLGLVLRQSLAAVLIQYVRSEVPARLLRVCMRTLRILSRDKKVLEPLVTDSALVTLARIGGLTALKASEDEHESYDDILATIAEAEARRDDYVDNDPGCGDPGDEVDAADGGADGDSDVSGNQGSSVGYGNARNGSQGFLTRGKRDNKESDGEEEEEEEDNEELQRKEATKVLCNVVYNSPWAQERFSALRLLPGLTDRLVKGTNSSPPPCGQFYELRLMFLLTALRPELRAQLQQEGGVSVLTAALERCLSVQWKEQYEVLLDPTMPPTSQEASQRAIEILKTLFNITYSTHRQDLKEDDASLYRHLVAVLRHCLLKPCQREQDTDEMKGHAVNLLSALPLQCLDVLLSVPLSPNSLQYEGVNMDCVHALLLFMESKLDQSRKIKEKLTPVLNLLTESCRAHRETRHYIRQQILPPLRDASSRPEEGDTVKSRLVRLMTHFDTDLKHCAADLLFVLCKENVSRFVKYTGYGNAAGLLATRGLLAGARPGASASHYSSDSDSDTEEYRQVKNRINPVTGRVEEEQPDPMEGMTESEKEEEACRLVELFNRLSRDEIIQPMGVGADGRLAPMTGLMDCSLAEQSGEDSDGDMEP